MSTKSSILLTDDNDEHWYFDVMDESITLEIDHKSLSDIDEYDDYTVLTIKKGCDLWAYLSWIHRNPSIFYKENGFDIKKEKSSGK